MANDAFALSPISASATLPTADDYQAIHDAFMETSRGRWFLTEYTRRNRNADTTMVLDAVARIEATLAAQKQAAASASAEDNGEAVRAILTEAGTAATAAVDRFTEAQAFPAQRGLRIIREVAWRLREVGYDSRICDILEAQADLIGTSHESALTQDLRAKVLEAFDAASQRILELSGPGATADVTAKAAQPDPEGEVARQPDAAAEPAPAPQPEITIEHESAPDSPVPASPKPESAAVAEPEIARTNTPEPEPQPVAAPEVALADATEPQPLAEPELTTTIEHMPTESATLLVADTEPTPTPQHATDDALRKLLDLAPAALEQALIAAPDVLVTAAVETPPVAAASVAAPEPAMASGANIATTTPAITAPATAIAPPTPQPVASSVQQQPTAAAPSPLPVSTLSLGETLLARGMVPPQTSGKPDPLAPIRRMSQAEKVAFFS